MVSEKSWGGAKHLVERGGIKVKVVSYGAGRERRYRGSLWFKDKYDSLLTG